MLPACAKTEVWRQLMDSLSSALNAPVICGQAVYGKLPFFQELRNRRSEPFTQLPGVRYLTVKIEDCQLHIGPFKTNEQHALDEELADAREKLPPWKESHAEFIPLLVNNAAIAGKHCSALTEALNRAKLLLEFSQAIAHTQDMEHALYSAIQFIVHKFKLSNAYITAYGKQSRYFDLTEAGKQAEQRVASHLRDSKATCIIQNVTTDFQLQGIKELEALPKCLIGAPLLHNREPIGYAIFTSETLPPIESVTELLYELTSELARISEYARVQESAKTDALTGLHNRAELVKKMDELVQKLSAQNQPVSVMMIDADNFKKYNDTKGHPEGDQILRVIAEILRASTPEKALCCRYGGEEFIMVIPEAAQQTAKELAEKIRTHVEQACPLTISIGLITCMNSSASRATLIKEADDALYRAKHLGKNRVVARVMVDRNLGVIDA